MKTEQDFVKEASKIQEADLLVEGVGQKIHVYLPAKGYESNKQTTIALLTEYFSQLNENLGIEDSMHLMEVGIQKAIREVYTRELRKQNKPRSIIEALRDIW